MLRLATLVALCAMISVHASAVTLDEIIANNLETRGGLAAIQKVTTLKITGTFSMQGMETSFNQTYKDGNKVRMEIDIQGQKMINAFDGKVGWTLSPFAGGKVVMTPPEQNTRAAAEADMTGNFVNTAAKGLRLTLEGSVDLNQSTAYKIKVEGKDSSISYVYIDAITWQEVQEDNEVAIQGETVMVQRKYSDFKSVGGTEFPTAIAVYYNGEEAMSMKWEKIEINVPVDDSVFAVPENDKK